MSVSCDSLWASREGPEPLTLLPLTELDHPAQARALRLGERRVELGGVRQLVLLPYPREEVDEHLHLERLVGVGVRLRVRLRLRLGLGLG